MAIQVRFRIRRMVSNIVAGRVVTESKFDFIDSKELGGVEGFNNLPKEDRDNATISAFCEPSEKAAAREEVLRLKQKYNFQGEITENDAVKSPATGAVQSLVACASKKRFEGVGAY